MHLRLLWPGKTQNQNLLEVQSQYFKKIKNMQRCEIIETPVAKGLSEKHAEKILEIEASGLEKYLKDDYIICLFDRGKEMDSVQFARFLEKTALDFPYPITFVVGGFLGLADRILQKAKLHLSLSRMTLSHELTRVVLLEQIYRAISITQGRRYAK
jgi:23S rRNA (pseudouridine1915-N3)-methyltransferase